MKFVRLFPFENDPIAIQRIGKVEKLHERVKYMVGTKAAQLATGKRLSFRLYLNACFCHYWLLLFILFTVG